MKWDEIYSGITPLFSNATIYPSQAFVSQDGTLQVQIEVALGQRGEESIELEDGTLQVTRTGKPVKLSVKGSAGC